MWKIADFGLTVDIDGTTNQQAETKFGRGSLGYRAPELYVDEDEPGYYSRKSDIWALGCILFEIATTKKAFLNDLVAFQFPLPESDKKWLCKVMEVGDEGTGSILIGLVLATLEVDISKRPSAKLLLDYLKTLRDSTKLLPGVTRKFREWLQDAHP